MPAQNDPSKFRSDLISALRLPDDAGDGEILTEARRAAAIAQQQADAAEEQEVIAQMIRDACGGLTETTARQVIMNRGGFAAVRKSIAARKAAA